MRTTTTFALILATSLAACGGDDGGNVTPIDAKRIDSSGDIDAPAAACQISSPNFGMLSTTMATFRRRPQDSMNPNPNVYFIGLGVALEQATPPDALFIQIWPGYGGVPAGEIVPGTYQLTGDNSSLANCGACVQISSNFVNGTGGDQDYMPTAGTLTINSVNPTVPGTIDMTLTGVMMQHVDIDPNTGATTPAADAATCVTQFSAQISGTIQNPAKAAVGPQLQSVYEGRFHTAR